MNTDVLFEDPDIFEKTYRILDRRGLLKDIRQFIAYRRIPGMEKSALFTLLSPYVLRYEDHKRFGEMIKKEEPERILVRNMEELGFLLDSGFTGEIITDSSLYTFNRMAKDTLRSIGVSEDTVPLELNVHEIRDRGCEGSVMVIYGRTPLMVSAQCVKKTSAGKCEKKKGGYTTSLKDRKNTFFPVRAECDYCYNIIYNSVPLCLFKDIQEIRTLSPEAFRIDITVESPDEAADIIEEALRKCNDPDNCYDFNLREYTRGHFKKGVE